MSSLKLLNQDAEHAKRFVALAMNINAAKGLQEVLKTNLGPKVSVYAYGVMCGACTYAGGLRPPARNLALHL
jgi:hypothetical protein